MNLQEAIKNYQTSGRKKTMDSLSAAEREVKINKLVVSVLSAVSELQVLIESKRFKENKIAKMWVRDGSTFKEEDKNCISFQYATEEEKFYPSDQYFFMTDISRQMEYIFGRIDMDIDLKKELDPNHSHEQIFDLNPEGLKKLQAFLLGPTLHIGVEKAMLNEAVSPVDVNKKSAALKI